MKTGMEVPLVALLIIIVAFGAYSTWDAAQIDLSAAQVQAMAAGEDLPAEALPLAELVTGWALKALAGAVATGFGVFMATKVWGWWSRRERQKRWQPGPNANYQPRAPQTKIPSEAELYRLALAQQIAQNGGRPGMRVVKNDDDEPDFTF